MSLPEDPFDHSESTKHSPQEIDPYTKAEIYYGDPPASLRKDHKHRTYSAHIQSSAAFNTGDEVPQRRRFSQDALGQRPRKFIIPVEETLKELLRREDSDKNFRITVEDTGPKVRTTVDCGLNDSP